MAVVGVISRLGGPELGAAMEAPLAPTRELVLARRADTAGNDSPVTSCPHSRNLWEMTNQYLLNRPLNQILCYDEYGICILDPIWITTNGQKKTDTSFIIRIKKKSRH